MSTQVSLDLTLGFLFVMAAFFGAYVFLNMLQSLYVSFVNNFDEKFKSVYYTFQPMSYVAVSFIKSILYFFEFEPKISV